MGDIDAQIGGCLMGRDSVGDYRALWDETFRAALETIWNQSERMPARHPAIPDGTYTAEAFLDNDGLNAGPFREGDSHRRRR